MKTIGIIGQGFVGTAVREGMKHSCRVWAYDKYKPELSNVDDIDELVELSSVIFVCVPTPMFDNGKCDTSIVESVVDVINWAAESSGLDDVVVVIKSTVPPGTTEYLNGRYPYVKVVFNPEFLTEKNAIEDFKNQNRIVIGGDSEDDYAVRRVAKYYRYAYPKTPIICTTSKVAEMTKYTINCFLATKLSFCNEIYQYCLKMDINYDNVIKTVLFDDRLGKSHWQVPGPEDRKMGWGFSCFPKDLNALRFSMELAGVNPIMLKAAWEKNLEVRAPEDRDWEQMKGRAVV